MAFRFTTRSTTATYNLTKSAGAVDEGSQVTITLDTTGVQNGQAIGYTISGNGITTADFVGLSSLTGSIVVQNGTASLVLTLSADGANEGAETFTVTTDNGSSVAVNINDTSQTLYTTSDSYLYATLTVGNSQYNFGALAWSVPNGTLVSLGDLTPTHDLTLTFPTNYNAEPQRYGIINIISETAVSTLESQNDLAANGWKQLVWYPMTVGSSSNATYNMRTWGGAIVGGVRYGARAYKSGNQVILTMMPPSEWTLLPNADLSQA
jgi:hypothetical protein